MAQRSPLKKIPVCLAHEAVILLRCTMNADLLFEHLHQYSFDTHTKAKFLRNTIHILFTVYINFCSHKFTIHVQHGKFCNQKLGQQPLYISSV